MLNLNPEEAVSFSDDEKIEILTFNNKWDKASSAIKNKISDHTLRIQRGYCAYCEFPLFKGEIEIEHIANKGANGEFTFESLNLVTSCKSCNSPINKGQKPTIKVLKEKYKECEFFIVHPFLDNPEEHIVYKDEECIMYDLNMCSPKGIYTISKIFNWHENWAVEKRYYLSLIKKAGLPINIEQKILEISTYKKK